MMVNKGCILIVDDDKRMRKAIGDYLIGKGYEIIEASDGDLALAIFYEKSNVIDLILLDIMMPKTNGLTVLNEIREISRIPIIMLTARSEENDQIDGFTKGADDYITKPFSPSLLIARIESVLRRSGKQLQAPLVVGALIINTSTKSVTLSDRLLNLTPKEYELLLYFVAKRGIPLTRAQILNAVWNFNYIGDGRTVDTHVKQLRAKLTNEYQYILTVHSVGYKFEVEK